MKLMWYKNRGVIIVIASLCVLMIVGLMLAEMLINRYPFICLICCVALLFFLAAFRSLKRSARNKKFI